MKLIPVESSNIKAIGFTQGEGLCAEGQLYIQYVSGKVWAYSLFPQSKFEDFLNAESKGKYFHKEIKGKYEEHQIEDKENVGG